ncbi:MAG: DUF4469 domain-containing protein [Treponemataceae bacterium]|nr:DUF4469 domain-containing protein [Treponemataceae bacterium]
MKKSTKYTYKGEPIPYIPVAVEESNLPGVKAKYGRVLAKTVDEFDIIRELKRKHVGVSEEMLLLVLRLYHAEMLDALKNGNAVSLCGMGVLSPQVDGAITEQQIANGRGLNYTLKFTPSAQATKATKNFRTEFVSKSKQNPLIMRATVERTGEDLLTISESEFVTITGRNLLFRKDRHFQSEKSGIFITNIATGEVFRIEPERFLSKSNERLRFFIPALSEGEYQMFVRKATIRSDGTENILTSGTWNFQFAIRN